MYEYPHLIPIDPILDSGKGENKREKIEKKKKKKKKKKKRKDLATGLAVDVIESDCDFTLLHPKLAAA